MPRDGDRVGHIVVFLGSFLDATPSTLQRLRWCKVGERAVDEIVGPLRNIADDGEDEMVVGRDNILVRERCEVGTAETHALSPQSSRIQPSQPLLVVTAIRGTPPSFPVKNQETAL
ncbi:hypothetical protein [Haloferax sp. CBA1148]|uniref:hypothetical protein n=1 Tax=Haloferax sp. CBA1148 TaxID=2650752 RepID=UPI00177E0E5E|nr:hypothetical protein [Haloferax sp. CBA1148]